MTKARLHSDRLCCQRPGCSSALTELQPRGAQQGKTFTLTLKGQGTLGRTRRSLPRLPAVFTPLTPTMKGFPCLVELRADVPVGTYPFAFRIQSGISNILLFTVGTFPEISEHEAGGIKRTTPSPPRNPSRPAGHRERHAAGRGPRLLSGCRQSRRAPSFRSGSAPLRFRHRSGAGAFDEKRNLLARNEDAPGIGIDSRHRLTHSPREGNYFIEVHDARFSKQEQNFYRLKIGTYAYAESVFPLGRTARGNSAVRIHRQGRGHEDLGETAANGQLHHRLRCRVRPSLPVPIALSECPNSRRRSAALCRSPAW